MFEGKLITHQKIAQGTDTLWYNLFFSGAQYGIAVLNTRGEFALQTEICTGEKQANEIFGKLMRGFVYPCNLNEVVYEILTTEMSAEYI